MARSRERGAVGIRLVQTAYHYRSLALYAKLGFVVREPLSVVQGAGPGAWLSRGWTRGPRATADVEACAALCARVHGHDRSGELRDAIAAGTATVVERAGSVSGYATGFGYGWHAVAAANEDLHGPARLRGGVHGPRRPRAVAQRRAPAAGAWTTACASCSSRR